jgi:hypothetical protein
VSQTKTLKDGTVIVLRDLTELRGRDRNLLKASAIAAQSAIEKLGLEEVAPAEGESDEDYAKRIGKLQSDAHLSIYEGLALQEVQEAAVVASLISWSRNEPIPTMETVGDLDGDFHDELVAAVGAVPFAETTFEEQPQGENPTGSSSSSSTPSRDGSEPDTESTPTLPSSGESIATAS